MKVMYILTWKLPAHDKPRWNCPGCVDRVPERRVQALVNAPRDIGTKQHRKMNPGSGQYEVIACQRVEVEEPK